MPLMYSREVIKLPKACMSISEALNKAKVRFQANIMLCIISSNLRIEHMLETSYRTASWYDDRSYLEKRDTLSLYHIVLPATQMSEKGTVMMSSNNILSIMIFVNKNYR